MMPTATLQRIDATTTLHNGVEMPWLGLGVFKVNDGEEVKQAIHWALDLGYRHVDTAAAYQNETGVGEAIGESGVSRDDIFLTTKCATSDVKKGYDGTIKAFEASLDRLGLEKIDLYLIHWPVEGSREAWRAFETIYEEGRARAIGVSNFTVAHLESLFESAKVTPMVNQIEFHPRLVQPELIEFNKKHDIQPEAWSPLMRGQILDLPELEDIAGQHDKTVAQIILRWELQHGVVTIPKSVHHNRIEQNADLFDFELSEDDVRRIDALDQGKRTGPDPAELSF